MKKSKITKKQIGIQFFLLLLLGLFVCVFLSLVSYDPADPGWSQTAWHDPVRNFGGYIGAYVSDVFLQFFGFIAFSIPILAIVICFQLIVYFYRHYHKPINYFSLSFRIIGFLAFIFSATCFFSLNIQDPEVYHAGGNLGDIVANSILSMMNGVAASVLMLVVCLACIELLTGLSWLYIFEKLGALVLILLSPFWWLFKCLQNRPAKEKPLKQEKAQVQQVQVDDRIIAHPSEQEKHQTIINDVVPDTQPISTTETDASTNIDTRNDSEVEPVNENTSEQASLALQEPAIKSTEELLQSIEIKSENTTPALQPTQLSHSEPAKSINEDDILTRMEMMIKAINERKMSHTQAAQITQQLESSIKQLSEKVQSNQPLFSLVDLPPESTQHDSQTQPLFEPLSELDTEHDMALPEQVTPIDIDENNQTELAAPSPQLTSSTPYFNQSNANDDFDNMHRQYSADTASPKQSFATNDVVMASDKDEDDNENSLIHPLLRRDDKPLVKPTTPLPSLNLLTAPPTKQIEVDHGALGQMSELIEKSLSDYRVKAKVVDYLPGPVITRFEIELAPGIKAARISTLDRDLARSLSMPSVRVVEVIPGKPYVGIELPNKDRQTVYFREVLDSPQFRDAQSPLTIVLGKDISGQSVVADLAKMPHLLVAGTTGSGKSVGVNAMILSILYKSQPEDVRFIMIDPKMLELSIYEGIPHLLTQVVTDMKDAANALNWCVNEMERRYRLMSALGVRNIAGYNEKIKQAEEMGRPIPDPLWKPTDSMDLAMPTLEKLPYIVVMVDEFADLIMAVGKKIEELIARLAQKARAAGIHLVLATQRPSVDVITGLIKANIPTRIAFTVSSKIDSRTILDQMGAESLLGMGDMLYLAPNSSIPIRVHGAFVRDEEVHAVVQDWKARGTPKYIDNVTVSCDDSSDSNSFDNIDEDLDPLFDQVVAFVVETRRASISSVQRKFRIGYNRAARIVEQMEVEGIVSSPSHNGNRQVLVDSSTHDY